MNTPLVTVVMPAYNAEKYIGQAIDSVLNQTYSDFILLIINDGSTDETEKIVLSFSDERIKYVKNEKNIGLVKTLNKSIELTSTEFYARMDADDIAVPERLAWQIDFLQKNPQIGVCGGQFEVFGNERSISNVPLKHEEIIANLLFVNQVCHPAIMLRTALLKANLISFGVTFAYEDTFEHKILELEDYALWHKLKGITQFANLDKIILKYRKEGQNLSTQKEALILERKKLFYKHLLSELEIIPDETTLLFHINLKYFKKSNSVNDLVNFKAHLDEIVASNNKLNIYPHEALKKVVDQKWSALFFDAVSLGPVYIRKYKALSLPLNPSQWSYLLKYSINKYIFKKG